LQQRQFELTLHVSQSSADTQEPGLGM
jgi:hypothetical protein